MAEQTAADRPLPHSLEAERSVLGAILIQNEAFNTAAEVIDADDFFREAHRRIFDKMVALSERGLPIDFVTLREELTRSGDLEEAGGAAYISALTDGVPRATNVEHYARIVKEKAVLRSLIRSAGRIMAEAYEAEEEAATVLDRAEQSIFAIAEDQIRKGFVSMRDLAHASFEAIEQAHERKQLITGVPTGFERIDEMTCGLQRGDLVIIAARPSMGKTSLALNIAQHVGTKTGMTVGVLQPRDVEGAAVPAHAVDRGGNRRPPPPHRVLPQRRLGQPRPGPSACWPTRRSTSTTRRRSACSRCGPRRGA